MKHICSINPLTYLPLQGAITPAYVSTTTVRNTNPADPNAATMKKYLNSDFDNTFCIYFSTEIATKRTNTPENKQTIITFDFIVYTGI